VKEAQARPVLVESDLLEQLVESRISFIYSLTSIATSCKFFFRILTLSLHGDHTSKHIALRNKETPDDNSIAERITTQTAIAKDRDGQLSRYAEQRQRL